MGDRVIGIDLGTTNSCVAILDGMEPVVIPNAEGSRTTASMVAVSPTGDRLVGQVAKRQAKTNPEGTVYAAKRLMGRRFDSEEVRRHAQVVPYQVIKAANGDAWIRLQNKSLSPAEVSAMILAKMKEIAESYLGEPIADAVITVPAYFDDGQRQATKDAGRIAGLNVLRILNEPTAAALAYGLERGRSGERIAVYDLGGGTFDISILELADGIYQVRSTNGDTFLGGEDFDERLIQYLCDEFAALHDVDLRQDKMALQRLKEAAEKAKHELSSSLETEINLPFIWADQRGPLHFAMTLNRGKLEALVEDLIDRTLGPCQQALEDAGLAVEDIDQVVLVGGQTRMPRVVERVQEFFKRAPHRGMNPDEVVAIGAAVHGGALRGQVDEVLLLDVTPLSLGVETAGGVFTKLIPKNTTIPTRKSEIFSTAVDNQPFVNVHVLQGEREMAADNKTLALFQLPGIPPAPRGVPQIEVTFEIDANGIVHVSARDLGTQKEQRVKVAAGGGLSEAEIQRLLGEAEAYRSQDRKRREQADLINSAETLIYTTEHALDEYGGSINQELRRRIAEDVAACRAALDVGDYEALRRLIGVLESSAHQIAQAIYASAQAEAKARG